MARHRIIVAVALVTLIGICVPRYLDGFTSGDYAKAAQMLAVVWLGFFFTSRHWASRDPRLARALIAIAATICIPPLLYHLYDGRRFWQRAGNLVLVCGIAIYTYGSLMRRQSRSPVSRTNGAKS